MLEARTQDITLQAEREKRETTEFIEILKTMSESERQQIKGVMIGIQLSKGTVRSRRGRSSAGGNTAERTEL